MILTDFQKAHLERSHKTKPQYKSKNGPKPISKFFLHRQKVDEYSLIYSFDDDLL